MLKLVFRLYETAIDNERLSLYAKVNFGFPVLERQFEGSGRVKKAMVKLLYQAIRVYLELIKIPKYIKFDFEINFIVLKSIFIKF
jgi:hypothetical protein